ncbi:hypothetical protein B0H13DRAFT_2309089 [Mycena leptocephala]|nr:hypothetical protein B0H13DRAFT_2309089 [Mycena leptocephala]
MPHTGACRCAQTTIALVFVEVRCSCSSSSPLPILSSSPAPPPPPTPLLLLLPLSAHTPPWLHIMPTDVSRRRRTSRLAIAGPVGEYGVSAACVAVLGVLSSPPLSLSLSHSPSAPRPSMHPAISLLVYCTPLGHLTYPQWHAQSAALLPTFGDAEVIHSDTSNFPESAKISIWNSARSEGTAEEE